MLSMTAAPLPITRPSTPSKAPPPRARPSARRLVLVPASDGDELVRRYRLARLRLEPRRVTGDERFAHIKRSYD
jgi:hypothetical protein